MCTKTNNAKIVPVMAMINFSVTLEGRAALRARMATASPPALKFTSLSNVRHAHGVITLSLLSEQLKGRRFPKTHRGRDT